MRDGELVEKTVEGMEIREFLGLRMLIASDSHDPRKVEEEAGKRKCEVVRIRSEKEIDGYFFKPTKIGLYRSLDDLSLEGLPRSKRKKIKKYGDMFSVLIQEKINSLDLKEWLAIYKERMGKKEKGLELLNNEWIKKKKERLVFSVAKREGKVVGGYIIWLKREKDETLPSFVFGSSDSEYFKYGVNDLLVWNTLLWAKEKGYHKIKFGADTNFYGFHLSSGLFLYKAEWGFRPKPGGVLENLKIMDFSRFDDTVFFLTGRDRLRGNLLIREGKEFNARPFLKYFGPVKTYTFDDKLKETGK